MCTLVFPHSSVAVHVLTIVNSPEHSPSMVSSVNSTDASLQESDAVSVTASVILSHSTVSSCGNSSLKDGAVLSTIVNVAVVELSLPHSSVAVKVTVAEPVAPHSSESDTKSLDHVMSLHSSEADAPPLVFNQSLKASVFPDPSQSTVES